jgi:ABC-type sugar transport system ATPase subunit
VYDRPANLFVAGFIGAPPMNTIEARVVRDGEVISAGLPGARVPFPPQLGGAVAARTAERVVIGVRPEHLLLATDGIVPATVTVVESLGHERNVVCRLDDGTFVITRQDIEAPRPAVGETVHLTTEPEYLHVFDARTGERVADA